MTAVHMNRAQCADAMGVSMPTLDGWVRAGCPIVFKGSRGKESVFNLPDVIAWWGQRQVASAVGDKPTDIENAKLRKAAAESMLTELELAKAMGDVAPIVEFERAQAALMATLRQNILNVPQRAVLQLIGMQDETEFKRILRAELTQALEQSAAVQIDFEDSDGE